MSSGGLDGDSMRVLIVDDSDFFRELLTGELSKLDGIETTAATNGDEALAVLQGDGADCVLTDYKMPDTDGLELLDLVRSNAADVPVIMLTGKGNEDVASEAIKRGASDYITKETITEDGEIELIANRIRQAVYQQRARDELAEKREQLRQQNERLEFLNHLVRHDIANELTVAGGVLRGLESAVAEGHTDDLTTALDAIENATEIADTAGEMVEVFAAGENLDRKPVRLDTVAQSVLDDEQTTYPDADLAVDGSPPAVRVRANEMLSSVVRNLVSNAVNHNDTDEPRVRVGIERRDDHALLWVADNGPGVPEPAREAIFNYDEAGTDSAGMGVGLHLVSTLVDAYDGAVRVEDNDPRGSVFEIELPLAAEA